MPSPVALEGNTAGLIALLQRGGALQFGSYTLKSGRVSPYFFNAARFDSGPLLEQLGEHYARAVGTAAPQAQIVFGPAYKGIPLCVATAMALSRQTGRPVGYLFNRKEQKSHGDAGLFVGRAPQPGEHLALVDDVLTDGATKREAVALLRQAFDAPIDVLVIALDRMEQDAQGRDALEEFQQATGIPVVALLHLTDLEAALAGSLPGGTPVPPGTLERLREYRARYGVPRR